MRIIFAVSGASGMPLALAALQNLASLPNITTCLIVSPGAVVTLKVECGLAPSDLAKFCHCVYDAQDLAAPPASGSWQHDGMIICPCSMSTLGAIATGAGSNLIHRAADVTLKERRPLVISPRETPFNLIHLRNMQTLTQAGATIMPFIPAFYTNDTSLTGLMRQFTGRMLDQLRLPHNLCQRWREPD